MTDAEREERAIWKLSECGYQVRREEGRFAGWWFVSDGEKDTASMDNLAALVELATGLYNQHWVRQLRKITPSA